MEKEAGKYTYSNALKPTTSTLRIAMAASLVLSISLWGWIPLGTAINTFLSVFTWWSFRNYFTSVGDINTARWLNTILIVLGAYGITTLLFSMLFDLGVLLQLSNGSFILTLFKGLFAILAVSSIAIIVVAVKLISINRHHSFPLKRIAFAALLSLPVYLLVGSLGTLTFIGQIGEVLASLTPGPTLYTDGNEVFTLFGDIGHGTEMFKSILGDIGDLFAFILSPFVFMYKVLIVLPYLFISYHFYRMEKWSI